MAIQALLISRHLSLVNAMTVLPGRVVAEALDLGAAWDQVHSDIPLRKEHNSHAPARSHSLGQAPC